MKKSLLSFLIIPLFIASVTQGTTFAPDTTTIFFDLDKVILVKTVSTKKALRKHKGLVIKHAFNLPLLIKAIHLWRTGKTTTTAYKKLFKKHPKLVDIIEEISLTKALIPETAVIIKKLHEKGYTLGVASNMAAEDFAFYQQKYPEIFSLFSIVKVIPDEKHQSKKPHAKFFKELTKEHAKALPDHRMVFIDDKNRNVKAAQRAGITSIQFASGQQLETDLQSMGIIV